MRIPCGAHRLQLPPKHQLLTQEDPEKKQARFAHQGVYDLVKDARTTVGYFARSPKQTQVLQQLSKELGEPENKFVTDCETRWNSTLDMLRSLWSLVWS